MGRCMMTGCKEPCPKASIFCRTHWFALPVIMRKEIQDANRRKHRETQLTLIRQAYEWLREKEKPDDRRNKN